MYFQQGNQSIQNQLNANQLLARLIQGLLGTKQHEHADYSWQYLVAEPWWCSWHRKGTIRKGDIRLMGNILPASITHPQVTGPNALPNRTLFNNGNVNYSAAIGDIGDILRGLGGPAGSWDPILRQREAEDVPCTATANYRSTALCRSDETTPVLE